MQRSAGGLPFYRQEVTMVQCGDGGTGALELAVLHPGCSSGLTRSESWYRDSRSSLLSQAAAFGNSRTLCGGPLL